MTSLVIADEPGVWCEGMAAVLAQDGMDVVGKVGTAAALRMALVDTSPDVALVGIPMLGSGRVPGLSVIDSMSRAHPSVGVLVLSGEFDAALAVRLIGRRPAGVGYMLKAPQPDVATLLRAVRVVAAGGTFVDRPVIEQLRTARRQPESLECLSRRERGILALIAEGRTNSAISDALCVSPKTVETHVRGIFAKLGLRAAPGDHRRVLAVLRYLQADGSGGTERGSGHPEMDGSRRPPVTRKDAA